MTIFKAALDGFNARAEVCKAQFRTVEEMRREIWEDRDYIPDESGPWHSTVHELFDSGIINAHFAHANLVLKRTDLVDHPGVRVGNYGIYLLEAVPRNGGFVGYGYCRCKIPLNKD